MSGAAHGASERVGLVAGPVVRDDSLDSCYAVGGEPSLGSVKKSDCGGGFLVWEGFGVGEER
jgi:hypothetical protein